MLKLLVSSAILVTLQNSNFQVSACFCPSSCGCAPPPPPPPCGCGNSGFGQFGSLGGYRSYAAPSYSLPSVVPSYAAPSYSLPQAVPSYAAPAPQPLPLAPGYAQQQVIPSAPLPISGYQPQPVEPSGAVGISGIEGGGYIGGPMVGEAASAAAAAKIAVAKEKRDSDSVKESSVKESEVKKVETEKNRRVKRDAETSTNNESETEFDPKCNSNELRQIILKNIDISTAVSKRQIQQAAAEELGGRMDVICSTGTFSYIVNTELYCETEKNGTTCFAFRQAN